MITPMVCLARAQCVSLLGVGLEMESLSLKQQSVSVDQTVTVGELGFGVGRVRGGLPGALRAKGSNCFLQSKMRAELVFIILGRKSS